MNRSNCEELLGVDELNGRTPALEGLEGQRENEEKGSSNVAGTGIRKVGLPSGKQVLGSYPYQARHYSLDSFVGRDNELRMISAAWLGSAFAPPLSPLLIGDPGVGKNRLVYELSCLRRQPLYIMQGHEDITPEDMACSVRFRDDGSRGMEYVVSPLVSAMLEGGICFIDEIGKIRPRALALLVSVLDERRYIDSMLLGERIYAHPNFRFISATNTGDLASIPDFIQSRVRPVIDVGPPSKEEVNQILLRQVGEANDLADSLNSFWKTWIKAKKHPTPRQAIQHFALASSLCHADLQSMGQERFSFDVVESTSPEVTEKHLAEAFDQLQEGAG